MESGGRKVPIRNSGDLISGSYRCRYRSEIIRNQLGNMSELSAYGWSLGTWHHMVPKQSRAKSQKIKFPEWEFPVGIGQEKNQ